LVIESGLVLFERQAKARYLECAGLAALWPHRWLLSLV